MNESGKCDSTLILHSASTITVPYTRTSTVTNAALPTVTQSGVATVTQKVAQSTTITTITPSPLTATMHKYTTIPKTLTCSSPLPLVNIVKGAAYIPTYTIPFCGTVSTQTITTDMTTVSSTTKTTTTSKKAAGTPSS